MKGQIQFYWDNIIQIQKYCSEIEIDTPTIKKSAKSQDAC